MNAIYDLVFLFIFFSLPCSAEIQFMEIKSEDTSLVHINDFGFTETGRLELTVSNISLNHVLEPGTLYLNLSQIGFLYYRLGHGRAGRYRCNLHSDGAETFTFNEYANKSNLKGFVVESSISSPGVYRLFFQNCLEQVQVSTDFRLVMYNLDLKTGHRYYLSTEKSCLFGFFFVVLLIYLGCTLFWIWVLHNCGKHSKNSVFRIHHVILLCLTFKQLSFLIELVNLYDIKHIGYAKGMVLVLTSVSSLLNGVDVLVLMGLVATGWSILKQKLQRREKILIAFWTCFRVIANAVYVYASIWCPLCTWRDLWPSASHVIEFPCFIAILYPLASSTRHLLLASRVEGKSTLNFRKVKYFRRIFFFVGIYNYISLTVVMLIELCAHFTWCYWMGVAVKESTLLTLYAFIEYMFLPKEHEENFHFNGDVELAAAEALKDEKTYDLFTLTSAVKTNED